MRRRLRSWFDATMDRGTPALIGWLALLSLLLIAAVTAAAAVLAPVDTDANDGWPSVLWMSLLRTLDPGTMGGDTGGPVFLGLMLTVTVGGIFIVSALIGVLTTGMEQRIAELRKGRSRVNVSGHTVLLGWSDQVFTVVSELVKANRDNRRGHVVILADRDKIAMQDEIHARVGDTGKLRVICRTGSPLKPPDVELVSLDTARSIMVLSRPGDDADIDVIKTLLLLQHRVWPAKRPHVVAAISESHNMPAARLAAGEYAHLIDADDITVRLVVQSHRQAGLSTVYTDLLDFAGNEIYLKAEPTLVGHTFHEALHAYGSGCPIGMRHTDGTISLNPPPGTVILPDDQMIVLAEDDLVIGLTAHRVAVQEEHIVTVAERDEQPDRTLIIGWNTRGPNVLGLLDQLVEPDSAVDVAAPRRPDDLDDTGAWSNIAVGFKQCAPTSRRSLESLGLGSYQHVIVLADETLEPDAADDRTLITLLHLRDIEVQYGDPYAIVTEMNLDGNREIAQITKADDFIVSTKLISLLLTQLAENRFLQPILLDLFDPAGAEVVLKKATHFVAAGQPVSFATIVESAARREETAIGYRLHHLRDQAPSYGVVLNPAKTELVRLSENDAVVVIAET